MKNANRKAKMHRESTIRREAKCAQKRKQHTKARNIRKNNSGVRETQPTISLPTFIRLMKGRTFMFGGK